MNVSRERPPTCTFTLESLPFLREESVRSSRYCQARWKSSSYSTVLSVPLGWRLPGTIFGEVPLALGSPFPGGYRAAEPSRVMRVEPQQYYAIAASSPEVALRVSALARERIAGLQGIAAEPPKTQVTIFGPRWDAACGELRRFLARNQITYDWVTPDSPDIGPFWAAHRAPDAECPTIRLAGGKVISKPNLRELAGLLGLQTSARLPPIRYSGHRRGAGRPCGCRVWCVRRAAHAGH